MLWIEIFILAVVQGIAEFLPISSSGHVLVGLALFDEFGHAVQEKLTVNIVLHLGTLAAILVFYRRRIRRLLSQDRRVIGLLVVGSIPAAFVGLLLESHVSNVLEHPLTAGLMFPLTGLILIWSARHGSGEIDCRELTCAKALLIGAAQAFAILPGISRSGTTIVAGLACGLRRQEAATFSFLLAIPVIGGAGVLDLVKIIGGRNSHPPVAVLLFGALVSFIVGLAALWWLIRWIDQGKLHRFAWWVIPLGVAVILWQLTSLGLATH